MTSAQPQRPDHGTTDVGYWDRLANKYDTSVGLLSRPLPRMLELVGVAASGSRSILEVAAGTGLVTPTLAKSGAQVTATDYSSAMVQQLSERVAQEGLSNVQCATANIFELPYEAGSFDLVLAANVLHLVPDLRDALAGLKRVLKPGGLLVAPTFCHDQGFGPKLISRLIGLTGFPGKRRFDSASLAAALGGAGFEVGTTELIAGLIPVAYIEARRP